MVVSHITETLYVVNSFNVSHDYYMGSVVDLHILEEWAVGLGQYPSSINQLTICNWTTVLQPTIKSS